jgi:uncharacterized protein YegP (UPF0339 family)
MLITARHNYKQSVTDSIDSVKQNDNANNYRVATHKGTNFVHLRRGTLYKALLSAKKCVDLIRNRGVFGGFLSNKKIFLRRMRGIVAMLYKYFFTAKKKIHTLAHNDDGTLLDFENKNNEDGLSELKILVSVVRFRPGPPRTSIAHLLGYFLFSLSKSN